MPKPGYANFTVKVEAAKRLEEFSRRSGVSLVSLINSIAEKLDPNLDLATVLRALELAPSLKFSRLLESEVLKVRCAQLYYHVEAMSSIVTSLLKPSPFINLRLILIHKIWKREVDSHTVLASAGLIDPSIDIIRLIQNLENAKNSLRKILDNIWPNWRDEVEQPLLISDIQVPAEYLTDKSLKKEVLRQELKPLINEVFKVWEEASELVYFLSTSHPELKELLGKALEDFSKLFLLSSSA